MENPYRPDPEAFRQARATAQQQQVVTLKDDSARPPSTVGTSTLQGILMGPAAGQPSKSGPDVRPGWGKVFLRLLVWIWAAGICSAAIYRFLG